MPNPIELSVPALVLVLAVAGAGALLIRRLAAGLMVLAVAAAALAAGLVGVYPLKARLAAPVRADPRVWVLFAYPPGFDPADDAQTALTHLDRLGTRIEERTAPGTARAVLYDTARPSAQPPRAGHPDRVTASM